MHSELRMLSAVAYVGGEKDFPNGIDSSPILKPNRPLVMSRWNLGSTPDADSPSVVQYWATVPHWFPILLTAVIGTFAAYPFLRQSRWQFSLSTLLFVTTLVAMGLGLVTWLIR